MRLRLVSTDRDPFWLAGHPERNERTDQSQALAETIQITRSQQEASGGEWPARMMLDRGNQKVTLDAQCRMEFATEWARMDFLSRLAALDEDRQEHRWQGDVWLRLDAPEADGSYKEWLLPQAAVMLTGTALHGTVGLIVSYRVTAGGFAAEARSGRRGIPLVVVRAPGPLGDGGWGVAISMADLQAWIDETAAMVEAPDEPAYIYGSVIFESLLDQPVVEAYWGWMWPGYSGDPPSPAFNQTLPLTAGKLSDLADELTTQLDGTGAQCFFTDEMLFWRIADVEPGSVLYARLGLEAWKTLDAGGEDFIRDAIEEPAFQATTVPGAMRVLTANNGTEDVRILSLTDFFIPQS